MTSKEALDLLQTAVDDEITSLQSAPEKEWATERIAQLNEAIDMARTAINGTDPLEILKENLGTAVQALIDEHEMDYGGEKMIGEVYSITEPKGNLRVCFNDENVGYLLAGYVPASIHEKLEQIFRDHGYEMVDGDGNIAILKPLT